MTDAITNATVETLAATLDRLTSTEEIRQLAAKYCLALDMRDLDALVGLFPADVRVGRGLTGRKELRRWFDATLREQFDGTAHVTGNHIIEFDDAEHARGVVYSRNEHETGREWVIMTRMYWDRYERSTAVGTSPPAPAYWYATDLSQPPIGRRKMRWPGARAVRRRMGAVLAVVERVLGPRARSRGRRCDTGRRRWLSHRLAARRARGTEGAGAVMRW